MEMITVTVHFWLIYTFAMPRINNFSAVNVIHRALKPQETQKEFNSIIGKNETLKKCSVSILFF